MRSLTASILCLMAFPLLAANHYIVSGGTGTKDGSDFNNAFSSIPASAMVRGDVYFVAAGTYSSNGVVNFATAASGSTYCFIRAVNASNSAVAGYSSGYIGTAHFTNTTSQGSCTLLNMNYLDIDGITGTGTNLTYGIHFGCNSTTDGPAAVQVDYNTPLSSNPRNVFYRHVEMNNAAWGNSNGSRVWDAQAAGCTNIWIDHCYLHGGRVSVSMGGATNCGVINSYLFDVGSDDGALHCAMFTITDSLNYWISNNVCANMLGSANTCYVEPQGNPVNFYVIANIFKATSASESTDLGIVAMTSTDVATGLYVVGNTCYGLHSSLNGVYGGNFGSTVYVTNNIFQNMVGSPATFANCTGTGNNITNNSVSFADAANGNFHLSANTAAGTALGSPYNVDPDGVTRGSGGQDYSIGAYQFVAASAAVWGTTLTHP